MSTLNVANKNGTRESRYNNNLATVSIVYLLLLLAFFFWALFDTWIGRNLLALLLGYKPADMEADPLIRLVALTVVGGGLGGIINGMRSFLQHGPVFDGRYIWKYITMPWLGATNALFVYALINSGLSVFGNNGFSAEIEPGQIVAMFSIGVLAGYGSRDVFLWLDAQVTKLFKYEVMVPNVRYQDIKQAEKNLHKAQLELGEVIEEERAGVPVGGVVVKQEPEAGVMLERGRTVAITLAKPPLRIDDLVIADNPNNNHRPDVVDVFSNGLASADVNHSAEPVVAG